MNGWKVTWCIFAYFVVVCPLNEVLSHGFAKTAGGHDGPYRETGKVMELYCNHVA